MGRSKALQGKATVQVQYGAARASGVRGAWKQAASEMGTGRLGEAHGGDIH